MNSETSDRQRLLLNLTSKINLTLFILGFFKRSSARGGGGGWGGERGPFHIIF